MTMRPAASPPMVTSKKTLCVTFAPDTVAASVAISTDLIGSMIATSGLQPNGHAPQFDDDELPDSGGPSKEFDYDSADESDSDYKPEKRDEEDYR